MYFALTASSVQENGNEGPGSGEGSYIRNVPSGRVSGVKGSGDTDKTNEEIKEAINNDDETELDYPELHEEKVTPML